VLVFHKNTPATPTSVHLECESGMYVTPGIDGSTSGADRATAWARLVSKGKRYYVEETKKILALQRELIHEIKKIDGIHVPYDPQLSVIPVQSNKGINALLIAECLSQAGWSVNILQTSDQKCAGFHFCLTSVHTHQENFLESFVRDLTDAVSYVKKNPNQKPKGMTKAYGKLEKGVPTFVQHKIGDGYTRILNTLPHIPLSGLWSKPAAQTTQPARTDSMSRTFKA